MGSPTDTQKVKTYDPKKVVVIFGGVPITGFADGSFVEIKPSAARYSRKVGADGEVARARSNDDTAEVTITLMQTSPANAVLTAFMETDRLTNKGVLPLSITDLSGGSLDMWPQAWIKQPPDQGFAKEVGTRAWVFDTGQVALELITGDLMP